MHFLCLLDRCRSSQSTSSRLPSPSFSPLFLLPRVPPSRIGPPALITAPILAVLRVFLSVNRDELLIFRSIAAQFPPLLEAFVIEGIYERLDRYSTFFFALWRKEFDSKNGEIEIERFSIWFYRKLESGTDNGVTIVVLIELK